MMPRNTVLTGLALAVLAAGVIAIAYNPGWDKPSVGATDEVRKFSSSQEILDYIKQNIAAQSYGYRYGYAISPVFREERAFMSDAIAGVSQKSAPAPQGSGNMADIGFSTTNVQVEGVDEADFVKSDGKYIYVISGDKLVIADAYPAKDAKIVSETRIPGRPIELFVNDDSLVVFTENSEQVMVFPEYDIAPVPRYTQATTALLYDVSSRKQPELVTNYSINGNYFRARMIGNYVYFIVKENAYYTDTIVDVPVIRQGSEKIMAPDVYYFDNPEQNFVFHTIASLDMKSGKVNAESFLLGYSDNVYVSAGNIYISYKRNLPYTYYADLKKRQFYDVIVPLLPSDAQGEILSISAGSAASSDVWRGISSVLETTYDAMSPTQRREFEDRVQEKLADYEKKIAQESDKTIIHRIGIKKGDILYETKGEVPGTLLNQFSMDESGKYFRVATTSQLWTSRSGQAQYNNVFVLDGDMKITGKLEDIAPGERIYSTRFIGDRLYMVTFKRMDPLFVIDLSSPAKPEILGELKIPGFSDYLHPYDETHIIGVGKETQENGWGGVSVSGVKLALFDVSNVSKPKQLDSYVIGSAGTDSEALRDHRAFLFDKENNLLVIPVTEVVVSEVPKRYGYWQKLWQGAYVFGVTPKDGFELKGRISHADDAGSDYWNSPYAVRRSMYIGDVLYTLSSKKLLMNDIGTLEELNSIELPYGGYVGYGYVK